MYVLSYLSSLLSSLVLLLGTGLVVFMLRAGQLSSFHYVEHAKCVKLSTGISKQMDPIKATSFRFSIP